MKKKIEDKNIKLSHESDDLSLESAIIKLIDKALKERLIELASDDVKFIAKELMPDIDKIVAKKVKQHFYEIGLFIAEKFNDIGE